VVDSSVHEQPIPAGFSITPYHEDELVADRQSAGRSRLDWLRLGVRIVAAGLAVLAAWGKVLVETSWLPDDNGNPHGAGYIRYTFDGWGHAAVTSSQDLGIDVAPIGGPNFGVLLCLAAAGLLIAATSDWLPNRFRRQPSGRILAGLTTAFLLAVVLAEVATAMPYRGGPVTDTDFRIGGSTWLAGAGCLLALLSCLPWPTRRNPAGDADSAAGNADSIAGGANSPVGDADFDPPEVFSVADGPELLVADGPEL
jgi:hypothetical protein